MVSCHTADSKRIKQEVNGMVILPPLVFPGWTQTLNPKLIRRLFYHYAACWLALSNSRHWLSIGLYHPLDGVTNPKYNLLHFKQLTIFFQKEESPSF